MKLQNKILLMIIIAFSFILFFNISNVKAVSYDSEHFIEWTTSSGTTWRICANEDFYVSPDWVDKNGDYWLSSHSLSTGELINISLYENGSDYWKRELSGNFIFAYTTSDTLPQFNSSGNVIYYGINIETGEKEAFFLVPEPEPEEKPVGILAQIVEPEELEKANLQIRVIIPLIIVVVVSFLGLRKTLRMLSQILHRS